MDTLVGLEEATTGEVKMGLGRKGVDLLPPRGFGPIWAYQQAFRSVVRYFVDGCPHLAERGIDPQETFCLPILFEGVGAPIPENGTTGVAWVGEYVD